MSCFSCGNPSRRSPSSPNQTLPLIDQTMNTIKHEILVRIPNCAVSLVEEGEAVELARGDFSVVLISDQNLRLATIIKVGRDLQWPLTKDEPVVKIDAYHYLFTLPVKEGEPLNYGVTISDRCDKKSMESLDLFLKEHSCFSWAAKLKGGKNDLDWKEFAPKVEDYNGVLARAIAGGTGHIVRGIFTCTNAYTNQVQKGGELILTPAAEEKNKNSGKVTITRTKSDNYNNAAKANSINQSIKRVRKVSNMTEKMSKAMLNGVGIATGSVMGPLMKSNQGRAFFSMMPGEVLLASIDAVDKILSAAEAAEKQALRATSGVAARMVSNRFGENAGEATEDALATVGHCAGTAWNVVKMRRALNPTSAAATSSTLRTIKSSK